MQLLRDIKIQPILPVQVLRVSEKI
jgi:hypothetical protein